jgi:hypothetical protein
MGDAESTIRTLDAAIREREDLLRAREAALQACEGLIRERQQEAGLLEPR